MDEKKENPKMPEPQQPAQAPGARYEEVLMREASEKVAKGEYMAYLIFLKIFCVGSA